MPYLINEHGEREYYSPTEAAALLKNNSNKPLTVVVTEKKTARQKEIERAKDDLATACISLELAKKEQSTLSKNGIIAGERVADLTRRIGAYYKKKQKALEVLMGGKYG